MLFERPDVTKLLGTETTTIPISMHHMITPSTQDRENNIQEEETAILRGSAPPAYSTGHRCKRDQL